MLPIRFPIPRFHSAGEVFLERGSLGVLRALRATRAFVLVSGSLWRDDAARATIERALTGTDYCIATRSGGEPTLAALREPLAQLAEYAPDWIIAIGGGSVIDSAKLLWAFYEHPDLDLDRACRPFGLPPLRGKARLVAVPTTAGTGSEVSSSASFLDEERGTKRVVVSHDLLPDLAILDAALAVFTPARTSAIAGLDAVAHVVEGYVSRLPNTLLDLQAEAALRVLLHDLKASVEAPNDVALRSRLQSAALVAGWVQNIKVPGVGHAVAHQLGSFGIPHGLACGILLPAAMQTNCELPAVRSKYRQLALALGMRDEAELSERIARLPAELGLPNHLLDAAPGARALAADDAQLRVAEHALTDPCANTNPRPLDLEIVRSILGAAL